MSDDDQGALRELYNTVELGLDARKFLESSIGRYVANRALEDMYAAAQDLIAVDPFDRKAIVALQTRHKIASQALSWLGQAVEAGLQAEASLTAAENTD